MRNDRFSFLRLPALGAAALTAGLLGPSPAAAQNAGWQPYTVSSASADQPQIDVALYYPTRAAARAVPMGPFTLNVAIGAPPESGFRGLVVLSHGTGGSELGHSQLAQALAVGGYLVAAPRHPGDNWQDRSLLMKSSGERYFAERPRHLSRVIDALLGDARWSAAIARDAKGPRIGALGHSAGGYSVLALAGAQPDARRIAEHCASRSQEDPVFCGLSKARDPAVQLTERVQMSSSAAALERKLPALRDARVRAVVAMSPVGVVFDPASLAAVRVPAAIHVAERDRFLVPKYHGAWVAGQMPAAQLSLVPGAGHFAFMDAPTMPIASEDGDIGADPPGFERAAYLQRLCADVVRFFDQMP